MKKRVKIERMIIKLKREKERSVERQQGRN